MPPEHRSGALAGMEGRTPLPERDVLTVVIQINGKLRGGDSKYPPPLPRKRWNGSALTEQNIVRHLEGLTVRKVVVMPGKLVNVVAN